METGFPSRMHYPVHYAVWDWFQGLTWPSYMIGRWMHEDKIVRELVQISLFKYTWITSFPMNTWIFRIVSEFLDFWDMMSFKHLGHWSCNYRINKQLDFQMNRNRNQATYPSIGPQVDKQFCPECMWSKSKSLVHSEILTDLTSHDAHCLKEPARVF